MSYMPLVSEGSVDMMEEKESVWEFLKELWQVIHTCTAYLPALMRQ